MPSSPTTPVYNLTDSGTHRADHGNVCLHDMEAELLSKPFYRSRIVYFLTRYYRESMCIPHLWPLPPTRCAQPNRQFETPMLCASCRRKKWEYNMGWRKRKLEWEGLSDVMMQRWKKRDLNYINLLCRRRKLWGCRYWFPCALHEIAT